MDSPMLKNPFVAGTFIEKIMVTTQTSAVNTAVTAKLTDDIVFSLIIYDQISIVVTILYQFFDSE